MLDATRANAKTQAVNTAFADIGHAPATAMPKTKGNLEHLAWEVFMSKHLKRLADAREKKAVAEAVKAGVMFDPAKQPLPEGSNALVYAGEVIEIACSVGTARARVDTAGLFMELIAKHGVRESLIQKLTDKYSLDTQAPHKFTATLITV